MSRSRSQGASLHGILLVDKAPDRTSHDVVARVRWLLGTKKVGHAGTLDPMATGLLVLGIGQGTRLLTHLVGLGKTYTATIRLGQATTTDDREGEPLGEPVDATGIDGEQIEAALQHLRGRIMQVPSTVSAIKIDGQRAYARARAGEDVQLEAREIRVDRFEVQSSRIQAPFMDLDVIVTCSSGTYVRALARDLGAALGVGAHLTALRRTDVGPFSVEEGLHVPARGEGDDVELPLLGLGACAARVLPQVTVSEADAAALGHGQRIERRQSPTLPTQPTPSTPEDGTVAALDEQGRLCAVLTAEGARRWRPVLVIAPENRS